MTSDIAPWLRKFLLIVFSLFLLFGIYNGYRICPYGMGFSDEPYHILNAMDYKNAPLTVMTSVIGSLIGNTFGWESINFRYAAWTLYLISIFAAASVLLWKSRNFLITVAFTSCLVYFESISRILFNLFGWDTVNIAFIALTTTLVIFYFDYPSKWLLLIISIICGISMLVKVTNFALVPALSFFFIWKFRRISDSLIFVAISLFTAVLALLIIYDSFNEYYLYLRNNSNPDASPIFGILLKDILDATYVVSIACFYIAQFIIAKKYSNSKISFIVLGCFAVFILNYLQLFELCISFEMGFLNSIVSLSVAIIAVLVKKDRMMGAFIFTMSCMPFLGSNTGLMKFMSIPAILVSLAYIINRENLKYVTLVFLALFISFAMIRFKLSSVELFQDEGMPDITETVHTPKINGLITSKAHQALIDDAVTLTNGKSTFVVGDSIDKYLYEYVLDAPNPYLRQGFGKKNNYQKQWYVDSIAAHISRAPIGNQYLYLSTDTTTLMYDMLSSALHRIGQTDHAILFTKQQFYNMAK